MRGERVTLNDLKLGGATNHRMKLERVGKHLLEGVSLRENRPNRGLRKKQSWRRESLKLMSVRAKETRRKPTLGGSVLFSLRWVGLSYMRLMASHGICLIERRQEARFSKQRKHTTEYEGN